MLTASRAGFSWAIPEDYNIGADVCDRWAEAEPDRAAIIEVGTDLAGTAWTFGQLHDAADRLAAVLSDAGLRGHAGEGRLGDRMGVLLPQRVETAVAHLAAGRMGAISVPLFTPLGEEALLR